MSLAIFVGLLPLAAVADNDCIEESLTASRSSVKNAYLEHG